MISPLILVNAFYTVIDSATKATNPIMREVLERTKGGAYTTSASMAFTYLSITVVIMLVVFPLARKLIVYTD